MLGNGEHTYESVKFAQLRSCAMDDELLATWARLLPEEMGCTGMSIMSQSRRAAPLHRTRCGNVTHRSGANSSGSRIQRLAGTTACRNLCKHPQLHDSSWTDVVRPRPRPFEPSAACKECVRLIARTSSVRWLSPDTSCSCR